MIQLSNNTVSALAAANTTIGTLTLLDGDGTAQQANWLLTQNAAYYFTTSGSVLQTVNGPIPAGLYAITIRANAQLVRLQEKARFVIQVS